jgi:hypothetical protein
MTSTRTWITTQGRIAMAAILLGLITLPASAGAQTGNTPGPAVTVTRLAGARVLVEVAGVGVAIRKEIARDSSHVVITTPKDELHVRVTGREMVVSTPGGTITVGTGRADEIAQLMAVLQRSDAAVRGLALLKQVPANARNFGQQALLLTRAVLELGSGPSTAVATHRGWVQQERERRAARRLGLPASGATVTRVGLQSGSQDRGPGDCWDAYAEEAIRIADDFVECSDDLSWYDALGWSGCSLIYTVRAEGAMFWFISCSGGFPFNG